MPFDASAYLDDPEIGWDSLTRVQKARGREVLFEAAVRADPDLARAFVDADEATRAGYFADFVDTLQQKHPEKFSTEAAATPESVQQANVQRQQRTGQLVDQLQLEQDPARKAEISARLQREPAEIRPQRDRIPILDPESEQRLAELTQEGVDDRKLDDDTLARFGPFVQALAPKRGLQMQSEAGVRMMQRGITAWDAAGRGFSEGMNPFSALEAGVPRADRRRELEGIWQAKLAEAEKIGPEMKAKIEQERQGVFERFDNEPLERFAYAGVSEAFEPIGTTAAMAAGGVGGARMLANFGIKPLTRAGVLANAVLVDAPLGALYAKTAPGYLGSLAARLTGREDLEDSAIINAVENAGIGYLFGAALRQGGMMSYARKHLGFSGTTAAEFRAWIDEMRAARAKPVHTEPVGRQLRPETPPASRGSGAPASEPEAPRPPAGTEAAPAATPGTQAAAGGEAPGSSAAQFLAKREAMRIPEQMVQGGTTTVLGARGLELPAVYVYAPRAAVQASHLGATFAQNPEYPLSNTRDYGNFAEQEKVLGVRNGFDVRRHVTDSPDAAVGPAVIAHVIDPQGVSRLVVLGGNNREMAISMLAPEKARELTDYTSSRADRFGLPAPGEGAALYRFVGDYDLREEGVRAKLQDIIDALNPAPGKVQNLSEMASVDAGNNVPLPRLQTAEMNMSPARAQEYVRGLIRDGSIDRNLRSAFSESPAQSQSYVNHLLLHGAYKIPSLVEARMDSRAGEVGVVRSMIDAGVPAALTLRSLGREEIADAIGRTFFQIARQVQGGKVRLSKILDDLARQGDIDPSMQVVQELAGALGRKVVVDKRGSVKADDTAAGIEDLIGDISRALSLQGNEVDLFGAAPDAAETMRRAIAFHFDRLEAPAAEAPTAGSVAEPAGARVRPMRGAESVPAYVAPRADLPPLRRPMAPANYVGQWDPGVPGIAPIEYFALRTPDGGITHTTAAAIQGAGYYLPAQLPQAREWTGAGDSAGVPLVDDRAGRIAEETFEKTEYKRLAKRLRDLRREQASRELTQAEHAEIDAIDRSLGQQFMEFYVPKEAPKPQPSKRAALENEGQMSLFARRKAYREAENQLYLDIGNTLDDMLAGGAPRDLSGRSGGAGPEQARGLDAGRGPEATLRGLAWTRRLASDGILRFVGEQVSHIDDLARLAQTLRNPQFETFYVIPLKAGRVLPPYVTSSRLPGQAQVFVDGGSIGDVETFLKNSGGDAYFLLHNHPSGNVETSWADRSITGAIARLVRVSSPHMEFRGHMVINHQRFSLIEWDELSPQRVSVYERELPEANSWDPLLTPEIPRAGLGRRIDSPAETVRWAQQFVQNRDGWVDLVFLDSKLAARAVLEVPVNDVLAPRFQDRLDAWAREFGAPNAVAYAKTEGQPLLRDALDSFVRNEYLIDALFDSQQIGRRLVVAPVGGASGRLGTPRGGRTASTVRLQEETAAYDGRGGLQPVDQASEAHLWYALESKAGRTGSYLPMVFRDLDKIRSIEMPELVALAEELMGKIPRIRRLPNALGVFMGAGAGRVTLDPRIFVDATVAARVLAHELGHLDDYLPDRTLARGNLLGRIATLRNYLLQTIDLKPTTPSRALTAHDRKNLRRRAEKDAGKQPPATDATGLARWKKDVKERFAKLLEDEIRIRGLTTQEVVFGELWELSQWWKPVPEGAPQSFIDYRKSSVELYADAISVLYNSPADLLERAPIFWKTWFAYLDRKPEVKQAFFELQDLLQKPYREVLKVRRQRIEGMYARGEEKLMRAWEEREANRGIFRGFMDRLKTEVHDVYWPIVRRARQVKQGGGRLEPRWDPEYIFGEHPLGDAKAAVLLQRVFEKVVAPLEAAGLSTEQLGRFMFYNRVLNEVLPDKAGLPGGRAQLANPAGETPQTARTGLLEMRLSLGLPRMEALEGWARAFQDLVFEQAEQAVQLGNYPAAALEDLRANRYNYATFAVLDYFEPYVPSGLKMQKGTFAGIANPFTATLLKTISMVRANQMQLAKLTTVKLLRDFFPAEIRAKKKPSERLRRGEKTLVVKANGRPVEYAAPADVVDMFDGVTPADASAIIGALNWAFRTLIYPLWITYNPAFQLLTSPIRDIRRAVVNLPGAKGFKLIPEYLANLASLTLEGVNAGLRGAHIPGQIPVPMTEAARAARAIMGQGAEPGRQAHGEPGTQDPAGLAREMLLNSAIGTPYDSFATHQRGDSLGKLMQQLRLLPPEPRGRLARAKILQPVLRLAKAIEFAGISNELLAKTASYKILARELGWQPREASDFVRNNVGVPNIHKQGRHIRLIQAVFPFFNVFEKGLAADYRLATGKRSAGGWWLRWAATDGIWSILQGLAKIGLFGAGVKLLYDRVSDYDSTNYNVLPVGEVDGGDYGQKTVYIRLPRDETHRLMSGIIYKAITTAAGEPGAEPSDVLAFGSGQVPGFNPLLSIGSKWTQYLSGWSPRDDFRERDILAPNVRRAGGVHALQGMLLWTYNETGLANFVKIDPEAESWLEYSLMTAPGINRLLKVGDYGLRERQFDDIELEQAARDRVRLQLSDDVRRLIGEYYTLRRLGEKRTFEQTTRYDLIRGWYLKAYRPQEEALFAELEAGHKDSAGQIRKELDESAKGLREVMRER